MRAVELAKVAASAEALRLRRIAHRQGMRAAYGAGAVVFAIGVLVLIHVVAYNALLGVVSPVVAAAILLGFDLVVAGVLAFLAMSNTPDAIEVEAKQVREQALTELRSSLGVMAIAGEVAGIVLRRPQRGMTVVKPRGTMRIAGELAARLMARR